jgi:hypothetical protein
MKTLALGYESLQAFPRVEVPARLAVTVAFGAGRQPEVRHCQPGTLLNRGQLPINFCPTPLFFVFNPAKIAVSDQPRDSSVRYQLRNSEVYERLVVEVYCERVPRLLRAPLKTCGPPAILFK